MKKKDRGKRGKGSRANFAWRWRVRQSGNTCRTHLGKNRWSADFGSERRALSLSLSAERKLEREKRRGTDLAAVEHVHGPRPAATLILPRHPRAAGLQLRPPRSTSKLIGIQSGEANLQGPRSTLEGPAGIIGMSAILASWRIVCF